MTGPRLRIYVDIDGVVLWRRRTVPSGALDLGFENVARGAPEFFDFVTGRCDAYWLSTWNRNGFAQKIVEELLPRLPPSAARVGFARWSLRKSDAVDPSAPFLWIEDLLAPEDRDWFASHGLWSRYVEMDPASGENLVRALERVRQEIRGARVRGHARSAS